MRNFLFFLIVIGFFSCMGNQMEMKPAKETAEKAIRLIGDEKFDQLVDLYTEDFSQSETLEERNSKFEKIIEVIGPSQNFKLSDSIIENAMGEDAYIILTYEVKHMNAVTNEIYTIKIEGGKYLIGGINIVTVN